MNDSRQSIYKDHSPQDLPLEIATCTSSCNNNSTTSHPSCRVSFSVPPPLTLAPYNISHSSHLPVIPWGFAFKVMSITCSMSEYNFPFTTSVAPYMDQHYVSPGLTPTMNGSSPSLMDINRPTYQAFPPSPSSSTGSNRVSKAKKGKRVHECEYPGCSKVSRNEQYRTK